MPARRTDLAAWSGGSGADRGGYSVPQYHFCCDVRGALSAWNFDTWSSKGLSKGTFMRRSSDKSPFCILPKV